ncbi:MAG: glycoside hydrolase family 43 protein [Verrucomicrobiota bacterium]
MKNIGTEFVRLAESAIQKIPFAVAISFLGLCSMTHAAGSEIVPGAAWHDEGGALIQAHGGGVLKHGDTWYWYGEDKRNGYFPAPGVSCYSSRDLVNWKNEGLACSNWVQNGESIVPNTPATYRSVGESGHVERPKVIYNDRTGMFVMWMHLEYFVKGVDVIYPFSSAGVAVSESPTGPFRFVDCFRPIPAELHLQYSGRRGAEQSERGSTFRDMTLFKNDDGKAYVVYAAESNYTMHIAQLTDDYCGVRKPVADKTWNRILIDEHREAPAMFKHSGKYYLITSGCSGWMPNAARLSAAETILGPYANMGNPCRGAEADTTFGSQGTFILPIDPERGSFIFMADRWQPGKIGESTYVWLPFTVEDDEEPMIEWMDFWNLSFFEKHGNAN